MFWRQNEVIVLCYVYRMNLNWESVVFIISGYSLKACWWKPQYYAIREKTGHEWRHTALVGSRSLRRNIALLPRLLVLPECFREILFLHQRKHKYSKKESEKCIWIFKINSESSKKFYAGLGWGKSASATLLKSRGNTCPNVRGTLVRNFRAVHIYSFFLQVGEISSDATYWPRN